MRHVVKVNFEATGTVGFDNKYANCSFVTEINGTPEEVKDYYRIGKLFNMGLWRDRRGRTREDDMMRVKSIFILEDCDKTTKFVKYLGAKYHYEWDEHFSEEEYNNYIKSEDL